MKKYFTQHADSKKASLQSEIAWRVDDGTVFITEMRTLTFKFDKEGRLQIDFDSILSTTST